MAKLPYMQFYPADYLRDTRCLSMASRGAWVDILCTLWNAKKRGQKTLSLEGWAGELGKPAAEVSLYLLDLESHEIGKFIHEKDEKITIICRRMVREDRTRRLALKRLHKHRDTSVKRSCNADETPVQRPIYQKSEVRNQNQKSEEEVREENTPPPPTRRTGVGKVAFPPDWKPDPEEMQQWKQHGINPFVEFATFRDHALANDRRCKDWKAAFRNWCRKAISMKEQKTWPVPGVGSIRASA